MGHGGFISALQEAKGAGLSINAQDLSQVSIPMAQNAEELAHPLFKQTDDNTLGQRDIDASRQGAFG